MMILAIPISAVIVSPVAVLTPLASITVQAVVLPLLTPEPAADGGDGDR
jgi:hypothetical protein